MTEAERSSGNPLYLQGIYTCKRCDANLRTGDSQGVATCPVCRVEDEDE